MKIIRHILSHMLLITLLVAVCAVYFYRHQVLPEHYAQQIDYFAKKVHPKLASIASKQVKKAIKDEKQEQVAEAKQNIDVIYVDDVPLVDEPVNQQIAAPNIEKKEVELVEVAKEDVQIKVDETKQTKIEQSATEVAAVKQPVETMDAATVVEQKIEQEKQPALSSDKQAADSLTVLREARIAFGQGNMEVAVNKYKELIELEDEADFHGELGNVYYAMGKWQQAGSSYYEAATRLIEERQLAQVSYLQRVIQGLDAERAEKLAKQLADTQGQ